jgi:excisionase family DNA binding protein
MRPPEPLITTTQAAARLGVARKTVREWIAASRLRGRLIGNRRVVEEASVAAMERQQRNAGRPYVRDWR